MFVFMVMLVFVLGRMPVMMAKVNVEFDAFDIFTQRCAPDSCTQMVAVKTPLPGSR